MKLFLGCHQLSFSGPKDENLGKILDVLTDSNADFDTEHGVIAGSGTQADPWIIEGWDINANDLGYCIYIGNTTEYFVVRDCYLHHAVGAVVDASFVYVTNSGLISI